MLSKVFPKLVNSVILWKNMKLHMFLWESIFYIVSATNTLGECFLRLLYIVLFTGSSSS